MQRSELAAILTDLVRRKAITLAEARETLRRFDAGQLPSLPLGEATDNDEQSGAGRWTVALLLVLLLANGHTVNRPLTDRQRTRTRKTLRTRFEDTAGNLAASVATGQLAIAQWQREMQKALGAYTRQMAVAGAGKQVGAQTQITIDAKLKTQWPFLRGFATQILARQMGDDSEAFPARPMSEQWIAARSRKYGGTGWGAFFVGQGSVAEPGVVDVWLTRDDPLVCPVCAPRHQVYFLPGVGPYPGWDCLGDCRCERVPELIPDVYADLRGLRSSRIHSVNRARNRRSRSTA